MRRRRNRNQKRVRRTAINNKRKKSNVIYKPQITRFKTDSEKLFEEIGDLFNINKSSSAYAKATRWRDNYAKAFHDKIIGGLESVYASEETIKRAHETYNKIKSMDISNFLTAQWTFPEELNISDIYPAFEREMRAERTIELWQQFFE